MRRTQDPPSPLDHVLQDGLGFEQVVACVEIERVALTLPLVLIQTQVGVRLGSSARTTASSG